MAGVTPPMKKEQKVCSRTSAHNIQTGIHTKGRIQKNISVCCEDYPRYINTLCEKSGGVFSVKVMGCAVISALSTLSNISCLQLPQNEI
jgi:hypothetical protein